MVTMSKSSLHLHFLLLLLLCCVSPSSFLDIKFNVNYSLDGLVACAPHQLQALAQFKNEFDTSRCNHSDYSNGIWCDNSTGAVTKLQFKACLSGTLKPNSSLFGFHQLRYLVLSQNNFISSSLPSEIGNLNKLEVLSLSSNGFLHQVPSSFSNLSLLYGLELSNNELTGSFPLLRNLTKLTILRLSNNHFSGTLYPNNSLFELHSLRYLDLAVNNFSSPLPSEFGNLNKLEVFSLSSNGFFGQVPPTISNLTWLTNLFLAENKLTGSLPLVHNLTKLLALELYDNNFSGNVDPSFITMHALSYLDLRSNNLNGSIEVSNFSTSSRLEFMYLGHNQFEEKILEPISKLINLKQLDLSFLNTRYPVDLSLFSSLKSLFNLILSGNNISPASLSSNSSIPLTLGMLVLKNCDISEFPSILKTLHNLEQIDLSDNTIKGKIPKWLWSLPRLISLEISGNLFTGFEGSREILVTSSVKMLALGYNNFEETLPNLPLYIEVFSAENNRFRGDIPLSICDRSSLVLLSLSDNNFTGPVPQCLGNLTFFDIRNNNLEGSLPDIFYVDASLKTLDVGNNRLIGKLPRSLINCSFLEFLSIDNNNFEDMFPFWLKALPSLQVLTLSSNKFYGPISPPHQGALGFPELRILEISDNKFTGSLSPSYFVNWKVSSLTRNAEGGLYMLYKNITHGILGYIYNVAIDLKYKGVSMERQKALTAYNAIDFSGNRLEGQIPESIGLLKALIALNLSNNAFTGHIPQSFAYLIELESLDLSRNQLSGTIPNGVGYLSSLEYINVSHNQLHGEIPQGTQITGQPKSSFEGNAGLCGLPLEENCFGSNTPPAQQPKEEDEEEEEEEEEELINWKAVVIGYGFGVLLGLAMKQVIGSYKPGWLVKITGLIKHGNR